MVPIDVEEGTCGKVVLNQNTLIILLQQSNPRIFLLDDGDRESGWFQIPGISATGKSIEIKGNRVFSMQILVLPRKNLA